MAADLKPCSPISLVRNKAFYSLFPAFHFSIAGKKQGEKNRRGEYNVVYQTPTHTSFGGRVVTVTSRIITVAIRIALWRETRGGQVRAPEEPQQLSRWFANHGGLQTAPLRAPGSGDVPSELLGEELGRERLPLHHQPLCSNTAAGVFWIFFFLYQAWRYIRFPLLKKKKKISLQKIFLETTDLNNGQRKEQLTKECERICQACKRREGYSLTGKPKEWSVSGRRERSKAQGLGGQRLG